MAVFENISILCRKNKISIAKLERDTGLGNATIRGWARSSPTVDKLKAVADYFGVTVDYLLGKVDLPFLSKDDKGLLDIDEYALTETKKPVPTDGDGLDEQDRQLVELMKLLTADQKEFLRAQLLTLTGQGK